MIACAVRQIAFKRCKASWGGATISQETGELIPDGIDAYAVAIGDTIEMPASAPFAQFTTAIDQIVAKHPDATCVGVFHDNAKGTIDVNPVEVLYSLDELNEFAETHVIVGGAYHFATGMGVWPNGRPDLYA